MAAPAVSPNSAPRKRQAPGHLCEHPHLVKWLKGAAPDETRERLIARYVEAVDRHKTMLRREPELITELKAVNRTIINESGKAFDQALRRQSGINAELAVIDELRVEAARAWINATRALTDYLERQMQEEHDAAVDTIEARRPELLSARRTINTLPKPPGHAEALATEAAIVADLKPVHQRKRTCDGAYRVVRSHAIDRPDEARLLEQARKGAAA